LEIQKKGGEFSVFPEGEFDAGLERSCSRIKEQFRIGTILKNQIGIQIAP